MSSKTSPNPFVGKLWELLANPENWDYIHWNEGGDGIEIVEPDGLMVNVLPKYFRQGKLCSFIRQLNLYGFEKQKDRWEFKQQDGFFRREFPENLVRIYRRAQSKKKRDDIDDDEHMAELSHQSEKKANSSPGQFNESPNSYSTTAMTTYQDDYGMQDSLDAQQGDAAPEDALQSYEERQAAQEAAIHWLLQSMHKQKQELNLLRNQVSMMSHFILTNSGASNPFSQQQALQALAAIASQGTSSTGTQPALQAALQTGLNQLQQGQSSFQGPGQALLPQNSTQFRPQLQQGQSHATPFQAHQMQPSPMPSVSMQAQNQIQTQNQMALQNQMQLPTLPQHQIPKQLQNEMAMQLQPQIPQSQNQMQKQLQPQMPNQLSSPFHGGYSPQTTSSSFHPPSPASMHSPPPMAPNPATGMLMQSVITAPNPSLRSSSSTSRPLSSNKPVFAAPDLTLSTPNSSFQLPPVKDELGKDGKQRPTLPAAKKQRGGVIGKGPGSKGSGPFFPGRQMSADSPASPVYVPSPATPLSSGVPPSPGLSTTTPDAMTPGSIPSGMVSEESHQALLRQHALAMQQLQDLQEFQLQQMQLQQQQQMPMQLNNQAADHNQLQPFSSIHQQQQHHQQQHQPIQSQMVSNSPMHGQGGQQGEAARGDFNGNFDDQMMFFEGDELDGGDHSAWNTM